MRKLTNEEIQMVNGGTMSNAEGMGLGLAAIGIGLGIAAAPIGAFGYATALAVTYFGGYSFGQSAYAEWR